MKVQFLPVNFQNVITRVVKRFTFSVPADSFSLSKINVYQKLASVSGGYSKEDLKAVDKLVKKLEGKDLDLLKQRYIEECFKLAKSREEFTPSIQKKIKKNNLVLYAINKIKNKDKFISENDNQLQDLAQKMAERRFSFRNLEYIVNDAKSYHLDDCVNGKKSDFKFEYLKKSEEKLKFSDGELEKPADKI